MSTKQSSARRTEGAKCDEAKDIVKVVSKYIIHVMHNDAEVQSRLDGSVPIHAYVLLPLHLRDGKWPHVFAQLRDNGRLGFPGGKMKQRYRHPPPLTAVTDCVARELGEEHNIPFNEVARELEFQGWVKRYTWVFSDIPGTPWDSRQVSVLVSWDQHRRHRSRMCGLSFRRLLLDSARAKDLGSEVMGVCAIPSEHPPPHAKSFRNKAFRNVKRHEWEFPHLQFMTLVKKKYE